MIFRKITKAEEESIAVKCRVIRDDNKLMCTRKAQFAIEDEEEDGNFFLYYCGGHFQELRQLAINGGEQVINRDEPTINATDEVSPL